MRSILIIGASLDKRVKYIEKELNNLKISQFDKVYISTDKSIKIEQIRYLNRQLHNKPNYGKYKAGIIIEAQKATIPAQNSLLKVLEEPPLSCWLFLSAPNPASLLPTIVSRCKIIRIKGDPGGESKALETSSVLRSKSLGVEESLDIKTAFQLAERHAKNQDSADQFLQNALLQIRNQYLTDATSDVENTKRRTFKTAASIARKLLLARGLLAANVNPRQILENLFLNMF